MTHNRAVRDRRSYLYGGQWLWRGGEPVPSEAATGCVAPPEWLERGEYAFFLDLDEVIVKCAAHPEELGAHYALLDLIGAAVHCGDGALALVSACPIADLDAVLDPFQLPTVGLSGLERRNAQERYSWPALRCTRELERARHLMTRLAALDGRLALALTSCAVALDYRKVPELEQTVVRATEAIVGFSGRSLELRRRQWIVEVRPRGVCKARAIATFMCEHPFRGRRPLYLGDALSDERAFEYVNAIGGVSVAVNVMRPTAARAQLTSVGDARGWLHSLAAHMCSSGRLTRCQTPKTLERES